jgi:hypothetical protein
MLHIETEAELITPLALLLQIGSDHNILGGRIRMRWCEYVALPHLAISECCQMAYSPL